MDRKKQIAQEISQNLPTFMRHMFPYVFQPINLPPSQIIALVSIQERKECSLTELSKEMHVSAPTITGIVSRLERGGFLKRTHHLEDRRVINVRLTLKGEKLVNQFRDNIKNRWEYILSKMPPEKAETLTQIMAGITKGFKDGAI